MPEKEDTQKAVWTPPHATHIAMERTLADIGSQNDGPFNDFGPG